MGDAPLLCRLVWFGLVWLGWVGLRKCVLKLFSIFFLSGDALELQERSFVLLRTTLSVPAFLEMALREHPEDPYTCLSSAPHSTRISNLRLHYSGCIPIASRRQFFESLPPESQTQIQTEERRISRLRAKLELNPGESSAGPLLQQFKSLMHEYRSSKGRPADPAAWGGGREAAAAWGGRDSAAPELPYFEVTEGHDGDAEREVKAPVVFFREGEPLTDPRIGGTFPRQKVTVSELLADDETSNPLMWEPDDGEVRYFHLPANNMTWVEEAMSRYYREKRPDPSDLLLSTKMRRTRTKMEMLLRQEFWRGQCVQGAGGEVHARHMRGMCDAISIGE